MNAMQNHNRKEHVGPVAPDSVFNFTVDTPAVVRLDVYLAEQFTHYSRSYLARLIEQNRVTVNSALATKAGTSVKAGDAVHIAFPPIRSVPQEVAIAHGADIQVVYEHEHFLIINKPANCMAHAPSSWSTEPTLADWLVARYADIAHVGTVDRPGIVHRLDKDTTGLMIIPRTNYAHTIFGEMFRARSIAKTYYAVVHGHPPKTGTINTPIGRDSHHKIRMCVYPESACLGSNPQARPATTHFEVEEYFDNAALVRLKPITGRTHQIRVHCTSQEYPLLGDSVYGVASPHIDRQALHAAQLEFEFEGKPYSFTAPLPDDMRNLVRLLTAHKK